MSGIAGILRLDERPVTPRQLEQMLSAMPRRGEDGRAVWIDGSVGVALRLRHSTPESRYERLPLIDPIRGLTLVADARIDNRSDLARALGVSLGPTLSDAELILAAYRRWGDESPRHLIGDFAFAVWDRPQRALFCARDPFGVRPFVYHAGTRIFAFASEVSAVVGGAEIAATLDETMVALHLQNVQSEQTATFHEGVVRLPAAHALSVSARGVRQWRYWEPDPGFELRLGSDAAYEEAWRETLAEAIRCRLRAVSPVGSLLSGGMDSSAIVCTARRETPGLPTFSALFRPGSEADERDYIDAVVQLGDLSPHYTRCDNLDPLRIDVPGPPESLANPNPSLFIYQAIQREASRAGVGVLLDGAGGDSVLFDGGEYLTESARRGHWVQVFRGAKGLGRCFGCSGRDLLWDYCVAPLLPRSVARRAAAIRGHALPPSWNEVSPIINDDFVSRIDLETVLERLVPDRGGPPRRVREAHVNELSSGFLAAGLESLDWLASTSNIEARYPFLDRRLVELCVALPARQRCRDGWTRMIVRRALAGMLPAKVQWRTVKANLGPNFADCLRTAGRDHMAHLMGGSLEPLTPYLKMPRLRALYDGFLRQPTVSAAFTLWRVASLARWLPSAGLVGPAPVLESCYAHR